MEEWRDVVGFEGYYQVSSRGQVKRIKASTGTRTGRILGQRMAPNGQVYVNLTRDCRLTTRSVHRLVAQAFHGVPVEPNAEVNHKDGDRSNNAASNLEWVSRVENLRHAREVLGKYRQRGIPRPRLKDADREAIIRLTLAGESAVSIADSLSLKYGSVARLAALVRQ